MKVKHSIAFISFLIILTGCSPYEKTNGVESQDASVNTQSEVELVVSGTVVEEMQKGKDGSVWKFKGDDGKEYSLVVSIPNLGPVQSKNIVHVVPNSRLTIKADAYQSGDETRLIAREVNKLPE